jgi:hypothetical protein
VTKKNADAEPENNPIKVQMMSHCRERRKVLLKFILLHAGLGSKIV